MKHEAVIKNLVKTMNDVDTEGFLANFDDESHVIDRGENTDISGIAAIKHWFEDTNQRFQFRTEILESSDTAKGFQFLALATGNFPGSPIKFSYEGIMRGQKIQELDIGVVK